MANKFQHNTDQECDLDYFNKEEHQSGQKGSVSYRIDVHSSNMSLTV